MNDFEEDIKRLDAKIRDLEVELANTIRTHQPTLNLRVAPDTMVKDMYRKMREVVTSSATLTKWLGAIETTSRYRNDIATISAMVDTGRDLDVVNKMAINLIEKYELDVEMGFTPVSSDERVQLEAELKRMKSHTLDALTNSLLTPPSKPLPDIIVTERLAHEIVAKDRANKLAAATRRAEREDARGTGTLLDPDFAPINPDTTFVDGDQSPAMLGALRDEDILDMVKAGDLPPNATTFLHPDSIDTTPDDTDA